MMKGARWLVGCPAYCSELAPVGTRKCSHSGDMECKQKGRQAEHILAAVLKILQQLPRCPLSRAVLMRN